MSNPRGIQEFYFTKTLPAKAVAIAQISVPDMTPAQLTDVNNTPYLAGSLGIWYPTQSSPTVIWPASGSAANAAAPDYNQSVQINGYDQFQVSNQFFELTNQSDASGTPLYYMHQMSADVTDIHIYDLSGNQVTTPSVFANGVLYHDLGTGAYTVQTVDKYGTIRTDILRRVPVLTPGMFAPTLSTYVVVGKTLQVFGSTKPYFIRFTQPNGFQALVPYGAPSNIPWFARVRFSIDQPPQEWTRQPFLPQRPYLLGAWIPGTVLRSDLVQFERQLMYDSAARRPDILVFDKNNVFKYALDGTPPNTPRQRGSQYNWVRGKIKSIDAKTSIVQVNVTLASDDICWGFYPYQEPDILYTAIDCNPFTNPQVKNRTIRFYHRTDSDPIRVVYHQVIDADGSDVAGMTNDPNPVAGNWAAADINAFADLLVCSTLGADQFTVTDIRQRGGGVAPQYLGTPETYNLWDSCYWDGKPYPLGAALAVYLPSTILSTQSRSTIESVVASVVPAGVFPVIHYIDPATGEESI